MGDKTGIEWTDATWNPVRGCSRVSDGCMNCYAEFVANRFKGSGQPYEGLIAKGGQWNGQIKQVDHVLDQPLRWKRPRMVFVNSMSDLFHENVPVEWIDKVFAVMAMAPQHTFQVLTKRPDRMRTYLNDEEIHERIGWAEALVWEDSGVKLPDGVFRGPTHRKLPLSNVWLGVSVENQETADERIPLLLQAPAAIRWLSCEPLLGLVNITQIDTPGYYRLESERLYWRPLTGSYIDDPTIDWVVAGGESGKDARPMHPDWARSLRDQCAAAGVPFFFKQWGEWAPYDRGRTDSLSLENPGSLDDPMQKFGKKKSGSLLDGVAHKHWPMSQPVIE